MNANRLLSQCVRVTLRADATLASGRHDNHASALVHYCHSINQPTHTHTLTTVAMSPLYSTLILEYTLKQSKNVLH